jgi:hypothetical protein
MAFNNETNLICAINDVAVLQRNAAYWSDLARNEDDASNLRVHAQNVAASLYDMARDKMFYVELYLGRIRKDDELTFFPNMSY